MSNTLLALLIAIVTACGNSAAQDSGTSSSESSINPTTTSQAEVVTEPMPSLSIPSQLAAINGLVADNELIDVIASPDAPEVVIIRLASGVLTPGLEEDLLQVVQDSSPDAAGFVFECAFNRSALNEFLAFLDEGRWKAESSAAALESPAALDDSVYGGGVRGCRVLAPLNCASSAERDAIESRAAELSIDLVDFRTYDRDAIGYDIDREATPGLFWNRLSDCE